MPEWIVPLQTLIPTSRKLARQGHTFLGMCGNLRSPKQSHFYLQAKVMIKPFSTLLPDCCMWEPGLPVSHDEIYKRPSRACFSASNSMSLNHCGWQLQVWRASRALEHQSPSGVFVLLCCFPTPCPLGVQTPYPAGVFSAALVWYKVPKCHCSSLR